MKKQIIISSIIAVGILGATTAIALNDVTAKDAKGNSLLATTSELASTPQLSTSKNETVFVLTDEAGNTKTKFIGSTIYSGAEELPFSFKITYYLDGNEISAKDLSGKSGHIKIVYSYDSTAKYLGKNVPFLALTGLSLNRANFSNLKLENGKIITETFDNYIITGYAVTGLNANFGTDFLPDSFTLEADTTNFKLTDSYTIFTNELIADIDTSKLSDLDSLVSSINQLSDGINKIVNGSIDLSNGLSTALDGTKTLFEGSKDLASGTKELSTGISTLSGFLKELSSHNDELKSGVDTIISNTLATINASLAGQGITVTTSNYNAVLTQVISNLTTNLQTLKTALSAYCTSETVGAVCLEYQKNATTLEQSITSLTQTKALLTGYLDLQKGLGDYTDSVTKITLGSQDLVTGATKLTAGTDKLMGGLSSLMDGTTKLYEGSVTLKDGLTTFKTSGIDKLVNFANKDLASFTRNARSTVAAAASYKNFGDTDAKNVKFIVKTPSI